MPSRRKPPIGTRRRKSAVWPIALGVALGAAVASDPPRSFGERIGPLRPGPGRLVGISYAPEGAPRSEKQRLALRAEDRKLSPGATFDEERQPPEILRRRAILALVQKNPDGAIQLLERALEKLPSDRTAHQEAILRSDLSAAHLQRFVQGDAPISSFVALDEAARVAFQGFSGVRFNHALALERLYLGRQAKKVWQDLAAARLEPGWATEAARHLTTLDAAQIGSQADIDRLLARIDQGDRQAAQELVRKEPQRARELATRDALWDWADSMGRGETAIAEKKLAVVELLSSPLADHGDRMALDTITRLRAASPEQIQTAARGLRAFKEGFRLYRRFDHEQGIATLEGAGRDLAVLKLPQELEVELYRAYLENNAGRPGSRERVASVAATSAGRFYPGVEALTSWFEALIAGREGRPYEQAEAYRRTRAIYAGLGEVENQSSVEGLLGEALVKLGRRDDALGGYLAAAAIAPRVRDPYRRRLTWSLLAFYARRTGLLAAGLALQGEMLQAAAEQDDPTAVSEPLLLGASLRAALGDVEGARVDLSTARGLAPSEKDPEDRNRTLADLARIEAEIPGARDRAGGTRALDKAVAHYAGIHQGISEMTVRASRSHARIHAGDLGGADEDLSAIIAFARRGGDGWLSEAGDEARYTFGREAKGAYSAMVRFQAVEARKPWRAFFYQETARELLAPSHSRRSGLQTPTLPFSVPDLATLRSALPADVALLEFALMDDRVISWLLLPEGAVTFERRVDREQVARLVAHLDPRLGLPPEGWLEASARLFDLLIRPIGGYLVQGRTLVVVPDGVLAGVSWSGLWDRERSRYVVEDYPVVVNPSAVFYLQALARSRQLGAMPSTVHALVLGDPAFDPRRWRRFKSLPGARLEARTLGTLYGKDSEVLIGESATWDAFREGAFNADVIHLGMHASLDALDPFRSFLLFADPGDLGARSLRDLATIDLPKARLVVLAACNSIGMRPEGEGIAGLARPFLSAGVPNVVGSLWPVVDDEDLNFVREIRLTSAHSRGVGASLRDAVLSHLERDRIAKRLNKSFRTWASFEILGSS